MLRSSRHRLYNGLVRLLPASAQQNNVRVRGILNRSMVLSLHQVARGRYGEMKMSDDVKVTPWSRPQCRHQARIVCARRDAGRERPLEGIEVHIFPEAMRRTAGRPAFDYRPKSTMDNGHRRRWRQPWVARRAHVDRRTARPSF